MGRTIKYAIYRGNVGLYALEYFDVWDKDLFEERCVLGYQHIKPEDLPIVVNSAGGRHSFYPVADNYVKTVEVDESEYPLTREEMYPKNSKSFEFGWINPEGDTYNTGFEGHYRAAVEICKELGLDDFAAERKLEKRGWVKVTRDYPYIPENAHSKRLFSEGHKITKKQADTLIELGYSEHMDFAFMVDFSEPEW